MSSDVLLLLQVLSFWSIAIKIYQSQGGFFHWLVEVVFFLVPGSLLIRLFIVRFAIRSFSH